MAATRSAFRADAALSPSAARPCFNTGTVSLARVPSVTCWRRSSLVNAPLLPLGAAFAGDVEAAGFFAFFLDGDGSTSSPTADSKAAWAAPARRFIALWLGTLRDGGGKER